MIAPLFRVPSRNSQLLDDTPLAREHRARAAQRERRITIATLGFAIMFAAWIAAYVVAAWAGGRL